MAGRSRPDMLASIRGIDRAAGDPSAAASLLIILERRKLARHLGVWETVKKRFAADPETSPDVAQSQIPRLLTSSDRPAPRRRGRTTCCWSFSARP